MKSKWMSDFWDKVTTNKVWLSFIALVIVLLTFVVVSLFSTNSTESFIQGIHVELFGVFFDALVLLLLFNWFNSIGEKKQRIERHMDEIDYFRHWESIEAKFRIRGNIRKLNKEGISKIDLSCIDISDKETSGAKKLYFSHINLDGSKFLDSDLSGLRMPSSTLNNITLQNTKFIGTGMQRVEFKNCHLQNANFENAYLLEADFSNSVLSDTNFHNANLKGVNFTNATIGEVNFVGAEVSEDFFDKVDTWNLKGRNKNLFEIYEIRKIQINEKAFRYQLMRRRMFVI